MVRTFSQPKPQARQQPIPFMIEGYYAEVDLDTVAVAGGGDGLVTEEVELTYEPKAWSERFVARRTMPPGVMIDLVALVTVTASGEQSYNVAAIDAFMNAVLLDDDNRKRWHELLHDADRLVEITMLGEITAWLVGEIVGRPTTR